MHIAAFSHGVAGVGDDAQIGLGPGFVERPGVGERCHDIVAAMDDDAGDVGEPVGVGEELVVAFEEAAVLEVVAFDPGEGDGVMVGTEGCYAAKILA